MLCAVSDLTVRPIPIERTRPLRQAILRPHQTLEELATHEPPGAFALGAFEQQQLVSVGFVAQDGEPGAWRIRGMATVPEARSRGAGGAILRALIEHAIAHGATRIWCNARLAALSLYQRAGMRVASEAFDEPKIGRHVVMERVVSASS
jgi:ribosomal protein S18 acetylase RimI-like enzyme